MQKIIGKKLYDTDSPEMKLLGTWDNKLPSNDLRTVYQELYRTNEGEYVIYSFGGPMTPYGERIGNDLTYGEALEPVTRDQALEWSIRHLPTERVIKNFPDEVKFGIPIKTI